MINDKPTMEAFRINSLVLNTMIEARVYLPPHYSPLYTYPVLIALDGQDYFNLGRIAGLSERLISERKMRHTVIVGLPYTDKMERWEKYHPEGRHHEAYIKFLIREFLPALSKQYAIDELAGGRFLIGDSLAATFSLTCALRYPHTFGNVILQSPYVNGAIIENVRNFRLAPQLSIYHSIGVNETAVMTTRGTRADFLRPNRLLHETLVQKELGFYKYVENDGNHTWTFWQDDLSDALCTMLAYEAL